MLLRCQVITGQCELFTSVFVNQQSLNTRDQTLNKYNFILQSNTWFLLYHWTYVFTCQHAWRIWKWWLINLVMTGSPNYGIGDIRWAKIEITILVSTDMIRTEYEIDIGLCIRKHLYTDDNPYHTDKTYKYQW